ncbi:MAG: hypothetical protein JSW02_07260 [candidate division WOR-3 bacterium]|nr:MAG: hypothetical protein JSW02_07260 [candidate division WOR-3 bacterium]
MNFNQRIMRHAVQWVVVFTVMFVSCQDYIVERSASDYFPLSEGDWWQYSRDDLYNPMTILVEVEALDTIVQVACYPVNFSDDTRYYAKDSKGISEYVQITHTFSGNEYTIAEGFVRRLGLPLVKGAAYTDSIFGSLDVSGELIYAVHRVDEFVADYEDDDLYGSVYRVSITAVTSISYQDSTVQNGYQVEEYYAPGIGLVRFDVDDGSYRLIDYEIE